MFFTFNTQGLLETIEGENGKTRRVSYNANQELVSSKDVDGNIYNYTYGDCQQRRRRPPPQHGGNRLHRQNHDAALSTTAATSRRASSW